MKRAWVAAAAGGAALAVVGCGGGSSPTQATSGGGSSSGQRLSSSHNAGRDCTSCHRDFAIAGTVYAAGGASPLAGATIRFTTAPDGGGPLLLTLTSDASGNFRSSQSPGFGSAVYVDAAGPSGARSAMKAAVTSGACNSCHDASRRITAG